MTALLPNFTIVSAKSSIRVLRPSSHLQSVDAPRLIILCCSEITRAMDYPDLLRGNHTRVHDCCLPAWLALPTQAVTTEFCGGGLDVHELELSANRLDAKLGRHRPWFEMGR